MRAQRLPPDSGREATIGDRAVVARKGIGENRVGYRSAVWRANSSHELRRGQRVVIEAVNGLI